MRMTTSAALLATASCFALAAALAPNAASAGTYNASDEASLKAAIASANADADANATITLTADITVSDPATMPAASKPITLNSGGFDLSVVRFNGPGLVTVSGGGEVQLVGSNAIAGNLGAQSATVRLQSGTLNATQIVTSGTGGAFVVGGAGVATATGTTQVGGSAGLLRMEAGGVLHTAGLTMGTTCAAGALVVDGPGSLLHVSGSISVSASTSSVGNLQVTGGGRVQSATLTIGNAFFGNTVASQLTVTNLGSTVALSSDLFLARGAISVLDGGAFSAASGNLNGVGGDADLFIRNPGSSFSVTADLNVGAATANGRAAVTVADSANLTVGGQLKLGHIAG